MANSQNINWYPGHMDKARRDMQEKLKAIDVVIEIRDARIPNASRNPILDSLSNNKPRLIILSKLDLADPIETDKWLEFLNVDNQKAISLDINDGKNIKKTIVSYCLELNKARIERQKQKGINPRPTRAMVCGIPNVGKSTLINRIAGKQSAKTEDRPGVTRELTWIHADKQLDILDTPGVLWPKFEDQSIGTLLGLTGAIKDDVLDLNMIAMDGIHILKDYYPEVLPSIYGTSKEETPPSVLRTIATNKHLLKEDGKLDTKRAATMFLKDLRRGKLGRLTLEHVDE